MSEINITAFTSLQTSVEKHEKRISKLEGDMLVRAERDKVMDMVITNIHDKMNRIETSNKEMTSEFKKDVKDSFNKIYSVGVALIVCVLTGIVGGIFTIAFKAMGGS